MLRADLSASDCSIFSNHDSPDDLHLTCPSTLKCFSSWAMQNCIFHPRCAEQKGSTVIVVLLATIFLVQTRGCTWHVSWRLIKLEDRYILLVGALFSKVMRQWSLYTYIHAQKYMQNTCVL